MPLSEIEQEAEDRELNKREREDLAPYTNQRGDHAEPLRVTYDQLDGRSRVAAMSPAGVIDAILTSSVNGGQLNTTTVSGDVLTQQVFGM